MNIEYEKDNKERIPFEHYLAAYQQLDPVEAANRVGVPYNPDTKEFTIRMMQKEFLVSWPDCKVRKADPADTGYGAAEDTVAAKIMIIRLLTRGVPAVHTGNFLTYRDVPWGEVYYRQFNGRCKMRLAFSYGNRLDQFRAACEKIGARKLDNGDASYEFEFLNGYYVRFILWEGDDEFPPSSQILFSDNFPLSFEAEDLAVVGDISIGTLKKI
ncbi:MAG: DUF3786 domain-containing protein [Candidatus Limivivens sp.]|nr:DUF3786 domain-containing protein [Candidatus Limivivens sp.]